MSLEEQIQKCSKLFKTRIFVDVITKEDEILIIKNHINKKCVYDINRERKQISNYLILSYSCFSSEKLSFSLSPNYLFTDETVSYYSFFAYYTHKYKNLTTVFAYIERNPILVQETIEQMERNLYEQVKDAGIYDDDEDEQDENMSSK